jgi:hypothetical protein
MIRSRQQLREGGEGLGEDEGLNRWLISARFRWNGLLGAWGQPINGVGRPGLRARVGRGVVSGGLWVRVRSRVAQLRNLN